MTLQEFLYSIHAEAQFSHTYNIMDRKILVTVGEKDVEIKNFVLDYKGDICIMVDAPEEEDK